MTEQIKHQITEALKARRASSRFSSNAKFARSIGITDTDYSNIIHLKWQEKPHLLSEGKWMRIAHAIKFKPNQEKWQTAFTDTFRYITKQLDICREMSTTKMLVDEAGIGKTYTCEQYERRHSGEVFYIDCSHCPGKVRFVQTLAAKLGLPQERTVEETFQACVYYINTFIEKPLLILDEAGDLEHLTILLIKRLYNATEHHLGIFMCGADGLKKQVDAGVRLKKNGYAELVSRMGGHFSRVSPNPKEAGKMALTDFMRKQAGEVCRVNGITEEQEVNRIINLDRDLRYTAREIRKHRRFQGRKQQKEHPQRLAS